MELESDKAMEWFTHSSICMEEVCGGPAPRGDHQTQELPRRSAICTTVLQTRQGRWPVRSRGVQWHENGDIQRARWIKPISRWSPAQTCGHVILSSTSPDTANEALAHSLFIFQKKVYAEKCKKEPLRCLKCHGWGHLASDCSAAFDTCGTCAQHHRMDTCKNTVHCVSCSMVGHASWARACPVFQRKCNKMNDRLEDNNMPYFPTAESWMQVREPPKVVYVMPPLPQPAQHSRNNNGMTQSTLPWKTVSASTRGAPPSLQQPPRQTRNDNSGLEGLPPMTHPHE